MERKMEILLKSLREKYGIYQKEDCTAEEYKEFMKRINEKEPIPEDVIHDADKGLFYRIYEEETTYEERMELLAYKKLKALNIIKSIAIIFAVLSAISLTVSLVSAVSLFMNLETLFSFFTY